MNVIPDSSSVRGVVIVAEHSQFLQFSYRYLRNIGNQIVGNSLGIFPDHSRFMGADGIKVAQKHYVPFWIRHMQVCENLLQHPLGLSIRICNLSLGAFFRNRHKSRIAVYGG